MKVLVLLNGCGHQDGSEIHEASMTLLALDQQGNSFQCASLGDEQKLVIDHLTSEKTNSRSRNMMVESARIARGQIIELSEVSQAEFDALVIPGGSGTAYNFCNFALKGRSMLVNQVIAKTIEYFYRQKKPIGAICIAPVLLGKVLGSYKPKMTIGNDPEVSNIINSWGAQHMTCDKGQCVVDRENRIVTTPAFMYGDSSLSEVWQGVNSLVKELKALC